jgi:hypothetical protein
LNQLARETRFVKREGKINGGVFFDLIVFHSESLKSQSLNDLSIRLKDKHDIEIKKQSLHERFNFHALLFLKRALEKMLEKQLSLKSLSEDELKGFKRVLIKDSTSYQIDESLAEHYPGSGGGGSKASIRIQFEYDILTGQINDLSVNPFNKQDAKDSLATLELTQEGDLIVRDLAYMSLKVLRSIMVSGKRYFLCRTNPIVKILEKNDEGFQELNFIKIKKHMKKYGIDCLEKEVYLGGKEKLKVRLILYSMPEEAVARRIRKAEQKNKKKGRNALSKAYKARISLNLFASNAGTDQLPKEKAWSFYRLRWQIELIFKIWKSICNIEKVKKVKKHRLECYIYSKLILIILGWQVLWGMAQMLMRKEKKALSFYKAAKTLLSHKINELRDIFLMRKPNIVSFIKNFYELSRSNHLLEKRKKKPTSVELLQDCINASITTLA